MLYEKYIGGDLKSILIPREEYKPFPDACSRSFWEGLSEELRKELIEKGEKYLEFEWPVLPATEYMNFRRSGDRAGYEKLYFQRRVALGSLASAECAEGRGRFLDDIVNGIWCICEETSWVIPAHNNPDSEDSSNALADITDPVIDLFSAETGALLSWIHYLLKEKIEEVSPLVSRRIMLEVKRRILDVYLQRDDFWWFGFGDIVVNNWNPWCNSSCLSAFLLLEEDEDRRMQAVAKCMRSLDRFIATYHEDGGCDEGTSYWGVAGGALFDCMEQLYLASDGRISIYNQPVIGNIGRFIYRSHISRDYYINFADGGARVSIPAAVTYMYGKRIGDGALCGIAAYSYKLLAEKVPAAEHYSVFRLLLGLTCYEEMNNACQAIPPFLQDMWLEGIQVMAAREHSGTDRGLYLTAKGGNNDESHNHNDVGQFMVYSDGCPVIVDAGVGTYTRKTFSDQRYEIWTMQSAYHNLPAVNGIQQLPGEEYAASDIIYSADGYAAELSMDIADAYPDNAGISTWKRIFRLMRGNDARIEIIDDFELTEATGDITLSLLTPCECSMEQPGRILLRPEGARAIEILYPSDALYTDCETIHLDDGRLNAIWGDELKKIVLKSKACTAGSSWLLRIKQI